MFLFRLSPFAACGDKNTCFQFKIHHTNFIAHHLIVDFFQVFLFGVFFFFFAWKISNLLMVFLSPVTYFEQHFHSAFSLILIFWIFWRVFHLNVFCLEIYILITRQLFEKEILSRTSFDFKTVSARKVNTVSTSKNVL